MSDSFEQVPKGLGPIIYSIQLRDLFAMAVLAGRGGMCYQNSEYVSGSMKVYNEPPEKTARVCYEYADAMLKEREKKS